MELLLTFFDMYYIMSFVRKLKNLIKLGELYILSKHREQEFERHILKDLFWECTLSCNASCKHCGSSAEKRKYTEELITNEAKLMFSQIATDMDASKILINVTGGEPLVRHDLCEVMEYASRLGFHWGMTTNGILLNDENTEKLKKANIETISISLDGIGDTHDIFRGVAGSYNTIIDNIKKLQEANFLKNLQITTVFNKSNINEIELLYDTLSNLGIKSWRIGSIDPIGRAEENSDLMLNGTEIKKLFMFIKKHKRGKMHITYACQGFLGLAYEKDVRDFYFNCRTGINVASILYNGDMFVCPNVLRRPEFIQGNIRTDNFTEIWNNKYKIFRDKERTSCDNCQNCDDWDYCLGDSFHNWDFEENKPKKCHCELLKEALC